MDDEVVDLLRPVVEGGHRGQDHRAHLGQRGEHAQVAEMQRALAHHENERPAFLERHVGGARHQGVGHAVGHRGRGLDAARHDDHAVRLERTGRERGPDVPVAVPAGRERLHVGDGVLGLLDDGPPPRVGDDEVGLDVRDAPQELQEADAVDRARGPAQPDDYALHSRNRRR
jgi:hypothetical protein